MRSARWWLTESAPARLVAGTVRTGSQQRITGLAGEAAFFAVLSLPPLLLGLVGLLGYLAEALGRDTVGPVREALLTSSTTVLSPQVVTTAVQPTLDEVLGRGRAGLSIAAFVVALWSGSRVLDVYIDTITVLYGLSGYRGVVRQRLMSALLYTVGLVVGVALVPLVVVGPDVAARLLPGLGALAHLVYWPVVLLLSVAFLSTLYHLAIPVRTPWLENLPGAVVALAAWIGGSIALRAYLGLSLQHSPVYGSLAAPVAVLLWFYVTSLAVLVGATINAELDHLRPHRTTARTRAAAETELAR
ncbi:YihY/virulence factor BrkB family protein [Saccharopolyspora rosea]|uniref:YihY/virulence factor BrkB family protein n=1 Tax=Saccharopolyspora rosea TaxID=524884 RepID=A0ABW3FYL3_9PSEU